MNNIPLPLLPVLAFEDIYLTSLGDKLNNFLATGTSVSPNLINNLKYELSMIAWPNRGIDIKSGKFWVAVTTLTPNPLPCLISFVDKNINVWGLAGSANSWHSST